MGFAKLFCCNVSKSILRVIKPDVQSAVGLIHSSFVQGSILDAKQLATHAMRSIFEFDETEAVLLVDARNAFNNLNRAISLLNIQV